MHLVTFIDLNCNCMFAVDCGKKIGPEAQKLRKLIGRSVNVFYEYFAGSDFHKNSRCAARFS